MEAGRKHKDVEYEIEVGGHTVFGTNKPDEMLRAVGAFVLGGGKCTLKVMTFSREGAEAIRTIDDDVLVRQWDKAGLSGVMRKIEITAKNLPIVTEKHGSYSW